MASKVYPSQYATMPTQDLENLNTDRSVDWPTMVRGQMYKSSAGWTYWDGNSRSTDAGYMRVSAVGGSTVSFDTDATNNRISAFSTAASSMRISAFSDDAALFRVSALGVTATTAPLSCDGSSVSAFQDLANRFRVSTFSLVANEMVVSAVQNDAALFHVSSWIDSGSVSAKSSIADNFRVSTFSKVANEMVVSAVQNDAALFHISSYQGVADNFRMSAFSKDGATFRTSTILTDNPVNATYLGRVSTVGGASATILTEGTAFIGQVSAILKDNPTNATYLGHVSAYQPQATDLRVSAVQADGVNLNVSAKSNDAGTMHVSTYSAVANGMVVSAAQSDAAIFRASSYIPVDTVGQMSIFRSLSLSASQAVKATAGAIYGYYLYNTTTTPQYVKFTNTSGAINVGTDVPVAHIMLPASAAANVWFGQGLKGFTAGIGVHATSAVADNATTPTAASACGGMIFYA